MEANKHYLIEVLRNISRNAGNEIFSQSENFFTETLLDLLEKGIRSGIVKFHGNTIELKELNKKYSILALHREYFVQTAYLIKLRTYYNYPKEKCKTEFADTSIDIAVLDENEKPLIFFETKCSEEKAKKLICGIEEYSKQIDKTAAKKIPRNDAWNKTITIFEKKPRYFCIGTPNRMWCFVVNYDTGNGFELQPIDDIPKYKEPKEVKCVN